MSDCGVIGTTDYIAEGWVDPSINFESDISGKQLCVFWVSPIGEPSNATNWRSFSDVELYAVSKEIYESVKATMERLDAVYDKAYDKAVSLSEIGDDWYEFTFDYDNQEFVCNTNVALKFPIKPILNSV
ncbi:hypothetical protein [Vibrio harveyi]|uniref:hypothetical protein n=1 Tax=Vibrio harveyi TaxID=669 RepID=UPI003D70FEE5